MNKNSKLNNVQGIFVNNAFYPRANIASGIMRIILSSKCNYQCPHCFQEGISYENQKDLDADFIIRVMAFARKYYGVRTARLTGGEPLIYPSLEKLFKNLKKNGINDIDLTTNGYFLQENIPLLIKYDIKLITVTINTLNPTRYAQVTGSNNNSLAKVLSGIELAKKNGFVININLTALDNIPISEVLDVINYSKINNFVIRICEPTFVVGSNETKNKKHFKSVVDKLSRKATQSYCSKCESVKYLTSGNNSKITIMHNLCDNRFCASCAKYLYLRLTNEGKLKPCLSRTDTEVQIPNKPTDEDLHRCFCVAVANMGNGLKRNSPKGLLVKNIVNEKR